VNPKRRGGGALQDAGARPSAPFVSNAMTLAPASAEDLAGQIAAANSRIRGVDLSRLRAIVEHTPEDMTATVLTGMTVAEFQSALGRHRQWVPIDPPRADRVTVGELLAFDLSGPRRYGYGTVREFVIGMRVVLGSGEIIKSGGKVVKNVAGYDLARLFIGARNSLGIIVEVTFKLRPLPEAEVILQTRCGSLKEAASLAQRISDSRLEPVIFDLHNLSGQLTMILGFAGIREDVQAQEQIARQFGFNEPVTVDYDLPGARKVSVLPSKLFDLIAELSGATFIARVGNGIVYYTGGAYQPPPPEMPLRLMARVKDAYDPRHILPEYSA
jgi:FAD/FMN-containing dehydrogenase